jgi:hypothetical protein
MALGATVPACSDDPAASPGTTTAPPSTADGDDERVSGSVAPSTTLPPPTTAPEPGTTLFASQPPEGCPAPGSPVYPNPATERWVPSPESGDVIDDFARLVLGWPDEQVVGEQPDGSATVVRIATSATPQPVELEIVADADGQPTSVCGARSLVDGEWSAGVVIEGRQMASEFGIRDEAGGGAVVGVHERFPDAVSAQLLVSHGPHVQQVAAADPERAWIFELDHPTTEPGWQMAFWRDADGAALAVFDTDHPAGDFIPN